MTRWHPVSIALSAIALGLALHAPPPLSADQPGDNPGSPVDSYLQNSMQGLRIPGLSVAVVRNGSFVLARGYGHSNVEVDTAVSPGSVFEIGGVSKQFTAAAVMLLVERGKITLDDRLLTIMPELPQSWSSVTVRHLLTHTSGLPNYTSVSGFFAARRADISRNQILASIVDQPLRFQPGEKWAVSSTDYFILGLLIERVSGQGYHRFLSEQIFEPLGMTSTRVNDYSRPIERRVTGYTPEGNGAPAHPVRTSPTRLFASGAMLSSAMDLARWQIGLLSGKLLKPSSVAQMWTPATLRDGTVTTYGFGSYIRSSPQGEPIIEQIGATAGFQAEIVHFPSDNTSVILLLNLTTDGPYNLVRGVHRIVAANQTIVR